ncbi:hypothetical protein AVEN_75920-1 [Araneus ventricosus]|uniref:Uncharacterized protein n=1 Tax=Araneus ventricosus TaxID=182803 RepID=A0A4Y2W2B5_ARAVE|nr:hypothetical protein AVEN_75920-1 [Araneus ventricosus]
MNTKITGPSNVVAFGIGSLEKKFSADVSVSLAFIQKKISVIPVVIQGLQETLQVKHHGLLTIYRNLQEKMQNIKEFRTHGAADLRAHPRPP